jgi:hypothetical protein
MNKAMENPFMSFAQMLWVFCGGLTLSLIQGNFFHYIASIHPLSIFSVETFQKISIYFTKGAVQGTGVVSATLVIKAVWKYSPADAWIKRIVAFFTFSKTKK